MKKLVLTSAVLLVAVAFAAPSAQAQVCIDFDSFCDGLELNASGPPPLLTGTWQNTDCAGTDVPIVGTVDPGNIANACGALGNAEAVGNVSGADWQFVLDRLDGSLDMNMLPGTCWIPGVTYTTSLGACPFKPQRGARPAMSTLQ